MPPETAAPAKMRRLQTTVNRRPVSLEIEPRAILLDVLRDDLGLTGAKRSCDTQVCGACTVLLDGSPVSACCTLAYETDGREVETIEGLAGPGLHPIQQAFVDRVAIQCGFCTPGFVLTTKALLAENPRPTRWRSRITWAESLPLHGLLEHPRRRRGRCRATRLRQWPERGHERDRGSPPLHTAIGHDAPRIDAVAKVTGEAQFAGDLRLHGMAYGRLRSPYAMPASPASTPAVPRRSPA